jgi:hypothetical protein
MKEVKSKRDCTSTESAPPPRRRRFRIEKLEERIAPTKGGKGTHNCPATQLCYTSGCGGY